MVKNQDRFEELADEIFDEFVEFDPTLGTYFGLHEYDSEMPDGSKSALENWIKKLKSYRKKLGNFSESELEGNGMNLRLTHDLVNLELFDLEEWKLWSKFPGGPRKIGQGLFLLLVRNHPPIEERLKSASERINQSARFLEETKSRLENPVQIYCEIALESSRRLPEFLDEILRKADDCLEGKDFDMLNEGCDELKGELKSYESWLKSKMEDSDEDFAIGRDMLEKRLRLRGVEMDPDSILELGYEFLKREREKLSNLAEEIDEEKTVDEIRGDLKSEHPEGFEKALEKYQTDVLRAREFVKNHDLATIPENEELKVVETPPFLRHVIPFAAYFAPAKFDEEQIGIYVVTPPRDEGAMKRHNYYSISNTSVHEAYPGHHLQLSVANQHPFNIRLLSEGTEFVEGWAHYCEDLAKELGYDDTPEHRFLQAIDLVWRAARIIVDVQLSSGEMSTEEAADFLAEQTGMGREEAESEVRRYTYTPGQPLSYLLGKYLINELREEVENELGEDFDLKWFHDKLLEDGSIPVKYHREMLENELKDKPSKPDDSS